MRRPCAMAWLLLLFVIGCANPCHGVELGIITGGEKGTYYQFGLNLKALMEKKGININVFPSDGSVENIYAVYKRPGTQMGIVQSDVLAFVAKLQSNAELKRIARKIKMVFPLYNEEIHLVGRREIADFDGLMGKKVAIGEEGSGTYLTAKLLFEISEIVPQEMVPIGKDEAIKQLKEGQIDAMFYVAGYPVKLFSEDVNERDNLALIPITHKSVLEFYPEAEIPANTYSWQKETIATAAVKAVLVCYDFKAANCGHIGEFARFLEGELDWLKANGHPKWKSVELDYPLKGWEQYGCVRRALGKPLATPAEKGSSGNPVLQAIKELL